MSTVSLFIIFGVFAVISMLFNFLFLKWTRTLGTKNLAPSEEERWSAAYKPAIGGISFYIIFLVSYVVYLFIHNPELHPAEEISHLGLLIVVTLGFFTGLADDAFNTLPWLKFSSQLTCGILLLLFDIRIEFFELTWTDSLLTIFWTVAVMNSINMLDNMDGITTVVSIFILLAAAVSEDPFAHYNFFYTFICGGTIAALAGFLVFNWHPSKIFMGDTGSLSLGGIIAVFAIAIRKELLIPIICGIFLLENLSVVLQVGYFKYTKKKLGAGKRIFLMAPLHHHYQKKGMAEAKIVSRFWIVGILLAILSIVTLKLR